MEHDLTLDEIENMAAQIGLTKLSKAQLEQLRRVTIAKRSLTPVTLAEQLTVADEPACIFSLDVMSAGGKNSE